MSSFVNDNVSVSKTQQKENQKQQEISEKEENNLQTTINNTNTKETTATNSNNDDNNEYKENYETINENKKVKQQQCINQKTFNNDNNKSNNDGDADNDDEFNVAGLNDDDDTVEDKNLNNTKEKSSTTLQQSLSGVGATTTICCNSMTPGDAEQQVSFFDKNQIAQKQSTSSAQLVPLTTTTTTLNNIQITLESLATSSLQANDGSVGNAAATSSSSSTTSPSTPTRELSPLPPLPSGLTSNITGTHHLPHICSEPIFGVQLRNNNNKSSTKLSSGSSSGISRDWRPDTLAPNCSGVIKSGSVSASASPSMVRKTSDASVLLPRRVSFPKSDHELVTGYLEPANPWEHVCMVKSISEIAELYMTSCQKHNTKPLQCILEHLKAVDLTKQLRRQPLLSLKSIKLAPSDCEALEEVLKRVQYKSIDLSDCKLDEAAASALFEMIEYYEATNELDISSNAIGMTHRGWISCTYMISHSQELQVLNAEGNPISKLSADHLGNALSTSNLHTLKLEHCGLKGAPLSGLCFKLWHNRVLKELWLAHNDLDCSDADTIAEMLKVNHYLELIDISNNSIRDEGLRHIVMALIMQSKELERRTTFQRTAAIDDDGESISPVEISPPVQLGESNESLSTDWSTKDDSHEKTHAMLESMLKNDNGDANNESILCKDAPLPTIEEKLKGVGESGVGVCEQLKQQHQLKVTSVKPPLISSVGSTIDENDGDEDTEDTVRSSTIKNSSQNLLGGGQSMLDKLLSMNSESSSEDGASNLSTDTLAACCCEDVSLLSDDIYDAAAATTNTTTTSTNTKAPTIQELDVISENDRVATVTSAILNPTSTMSTKTITVTSEAAGATTSTLLQNSPREIEHLVDRKMTPTMDEMTKSHLIETIASSTTTITTNDALNIQSSPVNINNKNVSLMSATQTSSSPAFSNNIREDLQHRRHNPHQNLPPASGIFEVTAEESDCLLSDSVARVMVAGSDGSDALRADHHAHQTPSRALDVNKNTKLGEDFDDTHSTDSAFESASEGDISRHLPEEFTRLSTSLESTRLDDIAKELAIETATIASESNECLIAAAAQITPSSTPTPATPPFANLASPLTEKEHLMTVAAESSPILNSCLSTSLPSVDMNTNSTNRTSPPVTPSAVGFAVLEEPTESPIASPSTAATTLVVNNVRDKMPKVTIAQDSFTQKYKSNSAMSASPSLTPTPPPPSTSPGGASSGLRRTETSCAFLTQSSRNRSQSTDSLCSDNSLDGSIGSGDLNFSSSSQLNEKIAKNDTLTRQQRPPLDATPDIGTRTPGGLKALAVWNNNLTKEAGLYISDLLAETLSIELLNIGKNCLSNDFVTTIKESLTRNTTLTTLGLQSAHLSAKGIETLSSILTFGGNSTLQRIDIRDNKLEVESLTKIAEVLKSNTTVTQIDIDDEPKRLSVGSDAHLDYARVLENVRSMCSRNEKTQAQILQEKSTASAMAKRRGGYYLGSRKISLTCHSRPVVDATKNVVVSAVSNSKLDIKRKAGARLRSPVPSPTTISPSSSPNRGSRFQVFRVAEVSPLTSPSTQKQLVGVVGLGTTKAVSSSSVAIPITALSADGGGSLCGNDTIYPSITSTSLPTSCSLPSMATISSSTQSIKRLTVSPRSRFLVRKVYEDPNLPLASRTLQPITPPINLPPTPISRNSKDSKDASPPTTNIEATPPPPPPEELFTTTTTTHKSCEKGIEEDLQHLLGSTQLGTPPSTFVTPPTIRQHNNTTTDTNSIITTTPVLKIKDTSSSTSTSSALSSTPLTANTQKQREQSTNNTTTSKIINDNQNTHPTTATTTISTSCCSNFLQSPASNLSALSTLSSLPSESSSSSSSSTSPASNSDTTDSSSSTSSSPASSSTSSSVYSNEALIQQQQQRLTVSSYGQCPIAVFGDNDITLTKNTVNEVYATQAAAARTAAVVGNIDEESTTSEGENQVILSSDDNAAQPTAQQQHQQQHRVRKVSWIANPTAVDKLLTLFHNPTTIFQRSSSPESKTSVLSTTTGSQLSQSPPSSLTEATMAMHQQQQMSQKSLVPMRKQSPPSWTRLGNDIIQAAGSNNADLANAIATTAAAVVTEQSRSFLDAASKQFRDFSKQVFRQNLSFGNEPALTTANASTTMITTASGLNVPQTTTGESGALLMGLEECSGVGCCGNVGRNGCSCGLLSSLKTSTNIVECNADCIPTEVKQEIKENISPEHTINEETLHTIQKLYGGGNTLVTTATTSDFKNNEDLMDLKGDCFTTSAIPSVITSQQQQQPTPPPTTLAASVMATTSTSGVEYDLPAHNT